MGKKVLLVDGHSIANRAFYGLPLLTNKDGEYTNAVYGFINMLISTLEEEKPDYLAIAFDLSGPTFRHVKFPEYKGTRKGSPQEFRPQIPLLKKVLDSMGVCRFEAEGYEADDILGTLATKLEKEGYEPTILSGDRDLLQMATDKIKIRIPRTQKGGTIIEEYYAADVMEKYGVTPLEYIDVKGLMGDPSDNIPGVPGVGEKTALRLIKEYHSMENIHANIHNIKQKKLSENLETYKQQAIDSKMLVTIVRDMDLEIIPEDLEYSLVLSAETVDMFQKLDFKNLLNRLETDGEAFEEENTNIQVDYVLINKVGDLASLVKDLGSLDKFGYLCLVEDDQLGGVAISFEESKSYWIEPEADFPISQIIDSLKVILENHEIKKIGHNLKDDLHIFKQYGVNLEGLAFDTLIAAYVLDPTKSTYEIDELGHMFISESHESEEALLGKGKKKKSLFDLEVEERTAWMSARANMIYRAQIALEKKLEEFNQKDLFYHIEMPLIKVLFDMEQNGINIDQKALEVYGQMISAKIDVITKEIHDFAGEEFNINSPKQLGVILFEKLEIPPLKKTKTGYSTSADVLEKLEKDYPIVGKVLEIGRASCRERV